MARVRLLPLVAALLLFVRTLADTVRTFPAPSPPLARFVYSPDTDSIFVAGTNVLMELRTSDLSTAARVETGPRLDSPACHASGCSSADGNASRTLTDNVNKALVLDRSTGVVVACGSLFQGSCQKFSAGDLSSGGEWLSQPVAANDAESSTFAFIGPQRYNRWGHGDVLYVGTTFTHAGDYRHDVPALSSRNLNDLSFAEYSFSKQSLLRIDVKYRDRFLVDYVFGFNSTEHVYFVVVQKKSHVAGDEEKGYITRLARACITDPNFDTYAEVTIQCGDNADHVAKAATIFDPNVEPNSSAGEPVLFAAFSSRDESDSSPSLVCSYPLSKIERLFEENIHHCFNGSMTSRNLDYVSGPILEGKCPDNGRDRAGNIVDFCYVGIKLSGRHPIQGFPFWQSDDHVLTLDASGYSGKVVIIAGTQGGRVILAEATDEEKVAEPFRSLETRSPVLQVMGLKNEVFYLGRDRVGKIPTGLCGDSKTCPDCAATKNPYCQWCAKRGACVLRDNCASGASDGGLVAVQTCIQIEEIIPSELTVGAVIGSQNLLFRLSGLQLSSPAEFDCSFDGGAVVTPGRLSSGGNGVLCATPSSSDFADLYNVTVAISFTGENGTLATATLPVVNCGKSSGASCNECLTASSSCRWCHSDRSCRHQDDVIGCRGGVDEACPAIVSRGREIAIPNDYPSQLSLDFVNLPERLSLDGRLFCMVSLEGAKMKIPAHAKGSRVTCERRGYSYLAEVAELKATVAVVTESEIALDATNFTLFKCSVLGTYRGIADCSLCLAKSRERGCGWCENSRCEFAAQCPDGNPRRPQRCPKPEIYFVSPTKGPIEGGTKIMLDGINLPSEAGAVRVRVGGRDCRKTTISSSDDDGGLVCLTPPSRRAQNATIEIETEEGVSRAAVGFTYAEFAVSGARPRIGPASGGISLTVEGSNLDIGAAHEVFLDDVPCRIHNLSRSSTHLVCHLGGVSSPRATSSLTVRIDGASRRVTPFSFTFAPDPIVLSVKPLQSYASGGRAIAFHGKYFSTLDECALLVYVSGDQTLESRCSIQSDRLVECPTPALPKGTSPGVYAVGLRAANVSSLLHLASNFPRVSSDLEYFADPVYYNVSEGYTIYDDEVLVIEGQNLAVANDVHDVTVSIGRRPCNVTSITNSQLLCVPPSDGPWGDDGDDNAEPTLVVSPSRSLRFYLGQVKVNPGPGDDVSPEVIGAVGAAAVVLIFLAVVVLVVLKHKSSEVEREYKRIQIQMDLLEHNVRSECKQAFAELQTDVTDLTMELEATNSAGSGGATGSKFPIYKRKTFLVNVFFPGVHDHPVILPEFEMWPGGGGGTSGRGSSSLKQVEELLLNKGFLLMLIETLEYHAGLCAREKINFASLLSVILATRMEYFSDVLKTLLGGFCQLAAASRHPDSFFRRSETIVEKLLTNWLAICLYDYVEKEVGPPLFVLCRAIKCQVEKGPVDAVTHEARYSLSESELLRQPCGDHSPVLCLVRQEELEEVYEVRALDIDSVTQVKAKILDAMYKNTPFSLRPRADEVDLEWQCGQDAHVVLQDMDLTAEEMPGGGKKINTLRHYGIRNKAVVSLIPKQFQHKPDETLRKDFKLYHLQQALPTNQQQSKSKKSRSTCSNHTDSRKGIPEVFLTRLLATKGTLKKFIDDFVLRLTRVEGRFPCCLKWLFDIFDEAASSRNNYAQSVEVAQAWKFNSVHQGLWASLLRNPDLVYDVEKSPAVENNLAVVAQILLAACPGSNAATIGREAPYHQLLFAKEIADYRSRAVEFYTAVRRLPRLTEFEFDCYMSQLSAEHSSGDNRFNAAAALEETALYVRAHADRLAVVTNSCDNRSATNGRLPNGGGNGMVAHA